MLEQQLDVLVLEDALDLDRHRTARDGLPEHRKPKPAGPTLSGATAGVNPLISPAVPGMVPDDVYALTGVRRPAPTPRGNRVAYVVWWIEEKDREYRSAIWLATVDGAAPHRKLTAGDKRDSSPRWSPDGTRLAFASRRGEEKSSAQVYVLPLEGGEAQKLTPPPEGLRSARHASARERVLCQVGTLRALQPFLAHADLTASPPLSQ